MIVNESEYRSSSTCYSGESKIVGNFLRVKSSVNFEIFTCYIVWCSRYLPKSYNHHLNNHAANALIFLYNLPASGWSIQRDWKLIASDCILSVSKHQNLLPSTDMKSLSCKSHPLVPYYPLSSCSLIPPLGKILVNVTNFKRLPLIYIIQKEEIGKSCPLAVWCVLFVLLCSEWGHMHG